MQGFSVYLASRTEQENQILQRKVESLQEEFENLKFVGLHPQGLAMSAHERMAVVVINLPEWTPSEVRYIRDTRAGGYAGPILVVAKATNPKVMRALKAMHNVVYLEKPFAEKDLTGILRKMLMARVVAQRIHRRYMTNEEGAVEFYGKNDSFVSRVCNLSKGGACLEFAAATPIRAGDVVRLKVELRDVSRVYLVPARVVWTHRSAERGGVNAGIEFIGAPDIQKTMMNEF